MTAHPGPLAPILAEHEDLIAWRRHLHAHPELAYEEKATADFIAARLAEFGVSVHRGLGGTGVVGTLQVGNGPGRIGIRADIDALPITEANQFAHRSRNDGKMHACGHDGHTTMVLGAARYLARTRNFAGTVHFVFQPAEEGGAGAAAMIRDGLFKLFPMDAMFGLHNRAGLGVGRIGMRAGPTSSAGDRFTIEITGKDAHAGMPHTGVDAGLIAAQIVVGMQTLGARVVNPSDMAAIAINEIHSGTGWGIIPGKAIVKGGFRSFKPAVRETLAKAIDAMVAGVAAAHGGSAKVTVDRGYPSMINDAAELQWARLAAEDVVGADKVDMDAPASLASEDFSFYNQHVPCAYVFLGNGDGPDACTVHNPNYDFNDQASPIGASYFARLVERRLAPQRD